MNKIAIILLTIIILFISFKLKNILYVKLDKYIYNYPETILTYQMVNLVNLFISLILLIISISIIYNQIKDYKAIITFLGG